MFTRAHIFAALLLALPACSSPTSYSLVAENDPVRYMIVADQPPAEWTAVKYDDSQWSTMGGPIGPLMEREGGPMVCARRKFDVGPKFSAFQTLTLNVNTPASWTAFLNGVQVATTNGPFAVPTGVMQAAGNVLAVELHTPAGQAALDVKISVDGDPTAGNGTGVARGPWVVAPTATGITIVWETDVATPSEAVVDGRSYDGGAGTHHQVTITDLEPSKAYTYHVVAGGTKTDDTSLATAAQPGERVRFVVFGDNRTNGDAHRRVAEAIEAEGPDFLFNTGDMVDRSAPDEWQIFFNIEYSLLRSVPLFPSIGNHETNGDGGARYKELFPVSGGKSYYGADFGDVHVASLDSNGDLGAQAGWLEEDLTAAEARGAKHLFILMHYGPFSSGSSLAHGSNGAARQHIVPIAKAHRVDAIFAGHDHIYERGKSDNLNYFVTGGGGAPLHSAGRIAETIMSKSTNHYLVVDVAGPTATITAKGAGGDTFDSVDITR